MELTIRSSQHLTSPALEEYIRRRLGFALDRLQKLVRGIECRIVDVNGPKGGLDKQCTVVVGMKEGAPIKVEAHESDAYRAVDRLARRLKVVLARRKRKGRSSSARL